MNNQIIETNKQVYTVIDPKRPYYPYGSENEGFLPTIIHKYAEGGVNIKEMIRNHAVGLLWSQGYTLHGKDRELIKEVLDKSGGIFFLMTLENCEFDYGHAIVNIHQTKGDGLRGTVPILFGTSQVARVGQDEELAITHERIAFDDSNYILRREATRTETKITFQEPDTKGCSCPHLCL